MNPLHNQTQEEKSDKLVLLLMTNFNPERVEKCNENLYSRGFIGLLIPLRLRCSSLQFLQHIRDPHKALLSLFSHRKAPVHTERHQSVRLLVLTRSRPMRGHYRGRKGKVAQTSRNHSSELSLKLDHHKYLDYRPK